MKSSKIDVSPLTKKVHIRNETKADYETIEKITRKAFWNLHAPGCDEHYLVHIMRSHKDFIPALDFVIEVDDTLIGNIMYTKAKLVDENKEEKEILTFGPVSILPEYQRMGYGKMLMEHSFQKATTVGWDTVVIFGNPANYVSSGFKSCKRYNVCLENDVYPSAMMLKELKPGVLDGRKWFYYDSPDMNIDKNEAQRFDESLEKMEKKVQPSQEEFYIHSHSFMQCG
ncbi:MAG: N-acetyltransferase [Caldisericia bacterium]|nr:N-acetyltransferase [Caldisericia bacterium]